MTAAYQFAVVRANIECGIGFSMTNTLKSTITFADGAVQQSNFHDFPLLSLAEMPKIELVILNSDRAPQRCGEVALGPTHQPLRVHCSRRRADVSTARLSRSHKPEPRIGGRLGGARRLAGSAAFGEGTEPDGDLRRIHRSLAAKATALGRSRSGYGKRA
jgi:hypothetical protein